MTLGIALSKNTYLRGIVEILIFFCVFDCFLNKKKILDEQSLKKHQIADGIWDYLHKKCIIPRNGIVFQIKKKKEKRGGMHHPADWVRCNPSIQ